MDKDIQMAASSEFKTMGELYDEASEDEILARLKVAAAEFLPDGWEEWRVREGVVVDHDPFLLNEVRFCLPAIDISKAFDPEAKSLQERPYRDMKVRMLTWPFCQGLILGPPALAMQIRGSALHCGLISQASNSVKDKLSTRKEASRALSEDSFSDSEFDGSSIASTSRRPVSLNDSTRLNLLEQEAQQTRSLLETILSRMDQRAYSSSEQEEEGGEDEVEESSGESADNWSWNPPKRKFLFDFTPRTKEQEPSIPEPSQEISLQGIECQRLGKETWNKIRYADIQKKLHASPVFAALKINPQLKQLSSSNSHFMEKTEGSYGTITHALLLQRAAFSKAIRKVVELCPGALNSINTDLLGPEAEFKTISDGLLQFVCGKRAEAIELRRKALTPLNSNIATSLTKIPPSTLFLFDEAKLEELSKLPSSSFDAFKAKKQYKRKYNPNERERNPAPQPKKSKMTKKKIRTPEVKRNRSYDAKYTAPKQPHKDRQPRRGWHA